MLLRLPISEWGLVAQAPNTKNNRRLTRVSDPVIIALIGAIAGGLPTLATIVSAILQSRENKKNFAKNSILQLINEDKTEALYGNLPDNYQNVLHEFDQYSKNGGNSYVAKKVEAYEKWYTDWQKDHIDKTPEV